MLKESRENKIEKKKEYKVNHGSEKYCKSCRQWLPFDIKHWYKDYSQKKEGYYMTPCRQCRIEAWQNRQKKKREQKVCQV